MNTLIQTVSNGTWNQDSIARDIINHIHLTLLDSSVFFGGSKYVIKHPNDLKIMESNCSRLHGLKIILDTFVNDGIQLKTSTTLADFYLEDNIFIQSSFVERYDSIVDILSKYTDQTINKFADRAHRDGIQLIPPGRYVGGGLNGVTIRDNVITSEGSLQPIFSSDGWYKDLRITDNIIDTNSTHGITIAGVISGVLRGNTDLGGNEVIPELYPLRLGGGKCNYHVLSMRGAYEYQRIEGISGTPNDKRKIPRRGLNIYGLDIPKFREAYSKLPKTLTRFERIERVIADFRDHNLIYCTEKEA